MHRHRVVTISLVAGLAGVGSAVAAQATRQASAPPSRPVTQAVAPAAAAPRMQAHATLNQLMQGILFPNSNVIFAAQRDDPGAIARADDPSMAVDPLAGAYGGWQAVENSGLALAEAATLLSVPGRVCSNGRPVPLGNADWGMFVQELRDAGLASYQAAQAKDQDRILEVSGQLTDACAHCHQVYRDKDDPAARCAR